jgi:26S proteasome regulatory subunit N10
MDNTDWGRNGDFPPTRWDSVQETVRLLFESKLQANGENMVGLLTMSERKIDMLATLCADDSRLNNVIHNAKLGIKIN